MDLRKLKWSVQVNVLLNNCKRNLTSLSLFAGRTVVRDLSHELTIETLVVLTTSQYCAYCLFRGGDSIVHRTS